MNVIAIPKKKLKLPEILSQLGITPNSHPNYFKDCFDVPDEMSDQFERYSSSISRVLSRLLPKEIDGAFGSADELLREITANPALHLTAGVKAMPELIASGLGGATGFLIVRKHPDTEKYQDLLEIREKIVSLQKTRQAVIRGSKKGEYGKEIVREVDSSLSSHNVAVLPLWKIYQVQKALIELAFNEGNEKAGSILKILGLPDEPGCPQLP